jgi:predicted SprT family Zn-dependent metalloprotease
MRLRSLNHVNVLAELLMAETYDYKGVKVNLHKNRWHFCWDNRSIKRFGVSKPSIRVISLSRALCKANLEKGEDIKNVILHEIAHAVQFSAMGYSDHGREWSSFAQSIGCDGKQYYDSDDVNTPQSKYTLVCPCCGREVAKKSKPKRSVSCGKCAPNRYDAKFKMELIQNY